MDAWLDKLWLQIVDLVLALKMGVDYCLAPLMPLGPVVIIIILAIATVALTKLLSAKIKTKRYRETQKKYLYWFNLRQKAMQCQDPEKSKQLARNIDQAELNKAYYDFFFESFLLSIATRYIPILMAAGYVNEAFRPEMLMRRFGRDYLLRFGKPDDDPILIGALFGYIIAVILVYCVWAIIRKIISSKVRKKMEPEAQTSS